MKRPGLQVRARAGYLALSAVEAERALGAEEAGSASGHYRSAGHAGDDRRSSGAADPKLDRHVARRERQDEGQLCLEPDAGGPGGAARSRRRASRCIAGGANSDLYHRGRPLAPGRVEFEVPPGPIELEIAVEDAAAMCSIGRRGS